MCLGEKMSTEAAGEYRGHGVGEENPDVPAIARAGPFQRCLNALRAAHGEKGFNIFPLRFLVEVGGREVARAVRHHGVDTERVVVTQVVHDCLVGDGKEGLVGA